MLAGSSPFMADLWRLILSHKMFTRYLVLTNVLVSGAIDGLGDFIEQKLEHQDPIVWQRTGRMSVIGLAMGLPDHFWYKFIDRLYPRRTPGAVARKVALDILIMGPPHITAFYIGNPQHYSGTSNGGHFGSNNLKITNFVLYREVVLFSNVQFIKEINLAPKKVCPL